MKRVLLTGASGFIGTPCVALLRRRGFEVHAVGGGRRAVSAEADVAWEGDLLDPAFVARLIERSAPTHLLHLAWYAVPGAFWTADENLAWARASLLLLERFAARGGRRAVVAGSCAEYDWRHGYCVEDLTPTHPGTLYGSCKNAVWEMFRRYAAGRACSAAWARLFFAYGPGEQRGRLVPDVIQALLAGREASCTAGTQLRDFLHVGDVARALVQLLDSEVSGAVNVCSGQPVAVKEVVERIATHLQARDRLHLGALPERPGDPPLLAGDNTRLSREVGWVPEFSLDSGLLDTVDWWRRELAPRSGNRTERE